MPRAGLRHTGCPTYSAGWCDGGKRAGTPSPTRRARVRSTPRALYYSAPRFLYETRPQLTYAQTRPQLTNLAASHHTYTVLQTETSTEGLAPAALDGRSKSYMAATEEAAPGLEAAPMLPRVAPVAQPAQTMVRSESKSKQNNAAKDDALANIEMVMHLRALLYCKRLSRPPPTPPPPPMPMRSTWSLF